MSSVPFAPALQLILFYSKTVIVTKQQHTMKQLLTSGFLLTGLLVFGQSQTISIDRKEKEQVIDSISALLANYYIFPEKTPPAISLLKANFKKGAYDKYTDPHTFADKLTEDVVSVIHDRHFHVYFDPEAIAEERKAVSQKDSAPLIQNEIARGAAHNFGFKEIKILDGNIGYVNIDGFEDLQYSVETINGAMHVLSNTKAVIIDLRNNHGGYTNSYQYLASFFFGQEPVKLYDKFTRNGKDDIHEQVYTLPYVNGTKRPGVPLYILTSHYSFSAAEALAYHLQSLKRAVIIGEVTGGGANFWEGKTATDRFYVHMPDARITDPGTKTNWEAVGVKPDMEVPSQNALTTAHISALEKLSVTDAANATLYQWHIEAQKSKFDAVPVDAATLSSYTGRYGNNSIILNNGKLYLQESGAKWEMIPMTSTLFRMEEVNILRIQIITEAGEVKGIKRVFNTGASRLIEKEK